MLNCPECNLTVTDAHEECPKCRTNLDAVKAALNGEVIETVTEEPVPVKKRVIRKKVEPVEEPKSIKDEMIEAVIQSELEAMDIVEDEVRAKEEMIAAVVEAEALAIIEEEEAAEFLCETCLSPVEEGQNFCQLCGASVDAIEEVERPVIPKTDEESNKFFAALGYFFFFLPILGGYYRNSKFAKFHAKQATLLFAGSLAWFLGLVISRSIIESTLGMYDAHGITATWVYWYLRVMIQIMHLLPFGLMFIGFFNAVQGKKRPLPIIGRFNKDQDV
jgi:uncharacterized membrane protein